MPQRNLLDATAAAPTPRGAPTGGLSELFRNLLPRAHEGERPASHAHVEARVALRRLSVRLPTCFVLSLPCFYAAFLEEPLFLQRKPAPSWAALALALFVGLWGGLPLHSQAFRQLRKRRIDALQPVSLAILSALVLAAWPWLSASQRPDDPLVRQDVALAPLLTLVVLTMAWLERLLRRALRSSAHALSRLAPLTARQIVDDGEREVAAATLKTNDVVRVRPRELIPIDGVVLSGRSAVHEQRVTGEPLPVDKRQDSAVIGGTVNGRGILTVRATRDYADSVVAAMVRYVRQAEHSHARLELRLITLSDVIAKSALIAAPLGGVVSAWRHDVRAGLLTSFVVCALVAPGPLLLAAFLTFRVALSRAAQLGVLMRSAATLESFAQIDTVVVGKSDTLTEGRPRVIAVVAGEGTDERDVLSVASGILAHSDQPIARAVRTRAETLHVNAKPVEDVHELPGMGSMGRLGSARVGLGNRRLLSLLGVQDVTLEAKADALCDHGQTVVFVAWDGGLRGLIGLVDPIKLTTLDALRELEDDGAKVILCTADARRTALHLGAQLNGLSVVGDVARTEKAAVVRKLIAENRRVAFASRSPQEREATLCAHLSIDLSLEAALERNAHAPSDDETGQQGVTLVRGDLAAIARARGLSRACLRSAGRLGRLALAYHGAALVLLLGIIGPTQLLLRAPWLACCGLFGGFVLLVGHALLLLRGRFL